MTQTFPFVSALVLAAGAARRMGRAKLLLPLRGKALLQHAVDAAAAASTVSEIVVVVAGDSALSGSVRLPESPPARWVVNAAAARGQASSLAAGLAALDARSTAVAVLLGDQPDVGAALIDRVVAAFARGNRPAARPIYHGAGGTTRPGHPVVLARALWPRLSAEAGDFGARELLRREPDLLLAVAVEGEPPADVDTEDDYRRLRDA